MRRKTADKVATAIEQEIIAGRFAVGAPLGTEAALCARYGVSRWALREAIAIVQNDGLVVVRRGRGGGAVVNAAPDRSLAAAICGFLLYAKLDNDQLIDARMMVDRLLYQHAARAIGDPVPPAALAMLADGASGRDHASASAAILDQILAMSGAPFLAMFGLALSKLTLCRLALAGTEAAPDPAASERLLDLRRRQLQCIVAVDANGAIEAMVEVAELWRALFARNGPGPLGSSRADARRRAERIADVLHPGQDLKTAGTVSAMLMLDAMDQQSGSDGLIGSEATLVDRYGVPRNILREGIRILERDGFVRAEAGRGGGIRVGEPDMSALIDRAARIFAFLRPQIHEIDLLAQELRLAAVELAITASVGEEDGLAGLAAMAGRCAAASDGDWRSLVFMGLADRSANGFLMLAERICSTLATELFAREPAGEKDLLEKLVHLLECGDLQLSRRMIAQIHRDWMAGLQKKIS